MASQKPDRIPPSLSPPKSYRLGSEELHVHFRPAWGFTHHPAVRATGRVPAAGRGGTLGQLRPVPQRAGQKMTDAMGQGSALDAGASPTARSPGVLRKG